MKMRVGLSRTQLIKLGQQQRLSSSLTYIGVVVCVCGLVMLVSACSLFPTASKTGTGNDTLPLNNPTPAFTTPTAKVTIAPISLQVVGCPSLAINWDSLVGTKSGVDKVQKVICGTFEGGALAALVNVRYYLTTSRLDFYVYDNLYGTPGRRFAVQGLIDGDAEISPTGSIITAENPTYDPLGNNVFKEYQWNGSGYAQILFPGIFPDMTHYQAEHNQAAVNAITVQATATPTASSPWQDSAFQVVSRMAQSIFHWPSANIKNSVVTYNTPGAIYVIQTNNYGPGGGGFISTLFRLDNIQTNIFEVKQVSSIDGTMLLSSPTSGAQLSSPVKVSGSYQSSGSILGRVVIYNDTYLIVGDTGPIHGSATTGYASFAPSVNYKLPSGGVQEGLLAFYSTNQNNISESNQVVLAKVLLNS